MQKLINGESFARYMQHLEKGATLISVSAFRNNEKLSAQDNETPKSLESMIKAVRMPYMKCFGHYPEKGTENTIQEKSFIVIANDGK